MQIPGRLRPILTGLERPRGTDHTAVVEGKNSAALRRSAARAVAPSIIAAGCPVLADRPSRSQLL